MDEFKYFYIKILILYKSSQCFCGNTYGAYGQAPDSECDANCMGNNLEICGGTWRYSLYSIVLSKIYPIFFIFILGM